MTDKSLAVWTSPSVQGVCSLQYFCDGYICLTGVSGRWRGKLVVNRYIPLTQHSLSTSGCGCGARESQGSLGPNVGQIGPKWDKSGTFSDQISVLKSGWLQSGWWKSRKSNEKIWLSLYGGQNRPNQNVLKSDLKMSWICPIWGQSDQL